MTPVTHVILTVGLVLGQVFAQGNQSQPIKIGALFGHVFVQTNPSYDVMQSAIDYVSGLDGVLPGMHLEMVTTGNSFNEFDQFSSIRASCHLVEKGIVALIGPGPSTSVKASHPVCHTLHIPQIAPHATDPYLSGPEYQFLVKMFPPDTYQSLALVDLMRYFKWTRMALLVSDSDYGRNGLETFTRVALDSAWGIVKSEVFSVSVDDPARIDARTQLQTIKDSGARVVILNALYDFALPVLAQAKAMDMFGSGWAWIVTDGVTQGGEIPGEIYVKGVPLSVTQFPGLIGLYPSFRPSDRLRDIEQFMKRTLDAYEMALVDSVLAVAYALTDFHNKTQRLAPPTNMLGICSQEGALEVWRQGKGLLDALLKVDVPGTRSQIKFTSERYISERSYDVMNFVAGKWRTIGGWESSSSVMSIERDVVFPGLVTAVPNDTKLDIRQVAFRVVTILESPFVMVNPAYPDRDGTPYIGLCIQLLDRLQEILGFSYSIELVEDGKYGSVDQKTKTWNGLVGKIVDLSSDLAVAPLTITSERQAVVDFTSPYLDTGYDVLTHKRLDTTSLFDFLSPFDLLTWLALLFSTYVCGAAVSACSFLSPCGYRGRYTQRRGDHCDKEVARKKDTYNFGDGVWFAISSFLIQGPTDTPISLSGRVVAATWWGITTIVLAVYTANLTAFVTVERLATGISSVFDLVRRTDEYMYGTVGDSAVEEFFSQATLDPLPAMYQFMNNMETYVHNASEGIERVRQTATDPEESVKYALIFDATTLEYAARQKPCVTKLTNKIFRQQGYGLALRKHSPYTSVLTSAVLNLRESGALEAMYKIWMEGPCKLEETTKVADRQITISSLAGIFALFGGAIVISLVLILPYEYIVTAYRDKMVDKRRQKTETSVWGHLKRRLRATCLDIKHEFCSCHKREYSLEDSGGGSSGDSHALDGVRQVEPTRRRSSIKRASSWPKVRRRFNFKGRRPSKQPSGKDTSRPTSPRDTFRGESTGAKQNPLFDTEEHLLYLFRKSKIDVNFSRRSFDMAGAASSGVGTDFETRRDV